MMMKVDRLYFQQGTSTKQLHLDETQQTLNSTELNFNWVDIDTHTPEYNDALLLLSLSLL